MVFTHDTTAALAAAVALVNSGVEPDTLTTGAQLDDFVATGGYTGDRARDAVRGGSPFDSAPNSRQSPSRNAARVYFEG